MTLKRPRGPPWDMFGTGSNCAKFDERCLSTNYKFDESCLLERPGGFSSSQRNVTNKIKNLEDRSDNDARTNKNAFLDHEIFDKNFKK
jgi:hypothetical protein